MSDSFLEAAAVRAAGKLVTEARCEVLLFGCCRSPELAITMGESFKPAWAEYIAMHDLLVASSTPFLMYDNSSWWQLHPALHIDASPLTVDKIAEALRIHRPRVVHFGTHGDQTGFAIQWEAAGGDGGKRCRVRLRASDIRERLDLRGAIVVSSACSTGSESLGEAILAAGAIAYVAPQMKNAIHLLGGFMGELLPRCARALSAAAATGGGDSLDVGIVRRCLEEALDAPSASKPDAPAFRKWYSSFSVFSRERTSFRGYWPARPFPALSPHLAGLGTWALASPCASGGPVIKREN